MNSKQTKLKYISHIGFLWVLIALTEFSIGAPEDFQAYREAAAPLVRKFDEERFLEFSHSLRKLAVKCRTSEEATEAYVDCLSIALAAEQGELVRLETTLLAQKLLLSQTEGALSLALMPARSEDRRELRMKACGAIALFLARLHQETVTGKAATPPAPTRETVKKSLREGDDLEAAYADAMRAWNPVMLKFSVAEARRETVPAVLAYSLGIFERILASSQADLTVQDIEALIRQSGVPGDQVRPTLDRVRASSSK